MKRDYPKVSSVSTIKRSDKPEEAEPVEKKTSRVNTIILVPMKRNSKERLMFIDINIAGQEMSAIVNTGTPYLFISKKAAKKFGLSIKKSNKKIKTVNFKEVPTVGVVRNVELQIGEWKGKEEFEAIQLDAYDFVLSLNFIDKIQACLYPWADQIHIVIGPLSKIVMLVHRDMKDGTKVLSSIHLVENVSYGRNIDLIEKIGTKASLKMLMAQGIDMKPADSTVESTPVGKVGCASGFEKKRAMQEQSGRVNAASKVHSEHFDSVLNSHLLAWQGRRGPFKVHKQGNRETVGNTKPRDENQGDLKENKSNLG
ncbi:hypothetical protein J1N35_034615 [Gossypium stocksii]|uniref:Aspartic peptidase DDI1-type domain-containing protein n=1 Tax=Gossypium stocksii TaxID=47602 RepID=A0A9D3USC9_9ROSI|nr:hypothetical protein J1N35_034615 [Gossypium stocksii]